LNKKRLILISLIALAVLALSGCASGAGVSVNWPGLAADSEKAYISSTSFIYAVDLKTGKEVWHYPDKADNALHFYANPVLTADGQLLIGSAGTKHPFVSLNTKTGKENWTGPFLKAKGIWIAPPLVMNDLIYAPNADGFLYILKLDGTFVESVELGGALWSAPGSDGKLIYVASLDHHLHIIDPASPQSSRSIDLGGAIPGGPSIGNAGAYVGTFSSKMELVKSNGDRQTLSDSVGRIWGAPVIDAVDGETLYYADLDGNVYSYDLTKGKQNWTGVKPDGPVVGSLLVNGDQIYVVTEAGTLVALDRSGKSIWDKVVGGKIYTTPVLSNDLILVAPYQADFLLAAFDADGKQAWTFAPAK
jgi:outer membrane protein assembly factor BamB